MTDKLEYILKDIQSKIKHSKVEGDALIISELNLSIKVYPPILEEKGEHLFLSLNVAIAHPSFYEEIIEAYFPAQADTFEVALQQAVRMFLAGLMSALFEYLEGTESYAFNSSFFGSEKRWGVCEGDLILFNRENGDSLWQHIKGALPRRLGNRPFYYIDAFVGEDGEISANCGINGEYSLELGRLLEKGVEKIGSTGYVRQFFLLNQSSPFTPYPHNRKDVERFTEKAVSLFKHCNTEESYRDLLKSLCDITADIDLACELKSFLPEICAELFYNDKGVKFSETVVLMKGSEEITAYKDQFTSYRWIKERLCRGFESAEFSNDLFRRLISVSATHSVISKAKRENAGAMNFVVQTALNVPSTYELR
ncbi:MAG: DUF6348 family protein [Deferribacteraceae bacterium]|nr:DUF6348 family protein [Deferribacteraceae bacterium]